MVELIAKYLETGGDVMTAAIVVLLWKIYRLLTDLSLTINEHEHRLRVLESHHGKPNYGSSGDHHALVGRVQ